MVSSMRFFSERAVSKLPELKGISPREVKSIGVIGGGTMGAGIANCGVVIGHVCYPD